MLFKKITIVFVWAVMILLQLKTAASQTKEIDINGLKVIYKPVTKGIVSVRLYIKGGTANYLEEQQGIEPLALSLAVTGGTASLDKVAFNSAAEKLGVRLGSNSTLDYGNISMTCLKDSFNASWKLFADAIMNPAFTDNEFKIQQQQFISYAKQTESDPDSYLSDFAMQNAYSKKNYAKNPWGTVTSLSQLTNKQIKDYYKQTVCKSRCFIVVVGNISEQDIIQHVKSTFGKMPAGTAAGKTPQEHFTKGMVKMKNRSMSTNYILGMMNAPLWNSPEGIPMLLAYSILSDRFFVELRTKRSLSYAPYAYYNTSAVNSPYGALYISTTQPAQAVGVMINLIDSLQQTGFSDDELTDKKQQFLTYHYMGLESVSEQSANLGLSEMSGSWKLPESFSEQVNKATVTDLNNTFKKYSGPIIWTYLGDKNLVKEKDFRQLMPVKE